jgi:hypothetical protein
MNKPPIRILSNLARSGGTLVSRCLGVMGNTVLLSEIHPRGTSIFNPLEQAQAWYKMFSLEEIRGTSNFVNAIQRVEARCRQSGRHLVIRDWAHLDFIGVPFIRSPQFRLELSDTLSPAFHIIQYALVRHPIDQWQSTAGLGLMQGILDLDVFLAGYRRFAELCVTTGFMRYEDFTRTPVPQMELLCGHLELQFDPGFIKQWPQYTHVTGDISKMSRGSRHTRITPLKRRRVEESLLDRFRKNSDYRRAIDLLGYEHPDSL